MSRIIFFSSIALISVIICGFMNKPGNSKYSGSPEDKPPSWMPGPMQSDDQIWKLFAKCKISMDKDLSARITFIPSVKAMDGKNVTISGFMLPLDATEKFKHFLLSRNAPTCAFCPPGGANEIVEVFSKKALGWKEDLIILSGTLVLVNDGKKGVFFQLKDAVE